MPRPNILVVAVDGLRASSLGAYGNTSFSTRALDGFAAESLLLDWCLAQSAELDEIYKALWQSEKSELSVNGGSQAADVREADSLPGLLATLGYKTILVTDDAVLPTLAGAAEFAQCVQLTSELQSRAETAEETTLARLFAAACEAIQSPDASSDGGPQFVWVHSQGMYGPWDLPLELQRELLDEEDPPPVESAAPPEIAIDDDDPDTVFRYSSAYAAQVMVFDLCWEELIATVRLADSTAPWIVMLIGTRGYSLGEHRRVGGVDSRLYAEQLHVPWLIRFPDSSGRLVRANQLISHIDFGPTLLTAIGEQLCDSSNNFRGASVLPLATMVRPTWREAITAVSKTGERAIRTVAWCLRQDKLAASESSSDRPNNLPMGGELFVRPDDRWEANDVAKLCPEVVDELSTALDNIDARAISVISRRACALRRIR